MNRARCLVSVSALLLLAPACDFGRAEAERRRLEAEMMERERLAVMLELQANELAAAQVAKAKADVLLLHAALDQFALNNAGRYPDDLAVLAIADTNGAIYLGQATVPVDPWDNAYAYEPPGDGRERPIVTCYGADGVAGGEGLAADITRAEAVGGPR